ncbi:MAG: ABC transporter substrate-binding protein, partial [Alphaproteobacteria bacterium]|nr:ABC transporter substrate-binding protein [Alphaproteobacteria bacterium]
MRPNNVLRALPNSDNVRSALSGGNGTMAFALIRTSALIALLIALPLSLTASVAAEPATARVALEMLPRAFANPHTTSLSPTVFSIAAVYDGLTRFNDDGALQPALAQGWERIDPVTWRFRLRPGVTFSNSAPLTSDAFVTAVGYLASDEAARENLPREVPYLKSARAVDALTVEIVTTEPVAAFPRHASAVMAAEPGAWRTLGRDGFARAPVGTGPFKVESMEVNRWSLAAVPSSWRAPRVERLEFVALPDATARAQALAAGRIDIAMTLGPDSAGMIETAGGRLAGFGGPTVVAVSFMTLKGGPLADARVRRALTHAIDRENLTGTILGGHAAATSQPAPRRALGYDPAIA